MGIDIRHWLEALGLDEYAAAFVENKIDETVLFSLTSDDLKEIGVVAVGHRRKILNAIASLSQGDPTPQPLTDGKRQPAGEAERRQLTVMFCDLVGSTELSGKLDPEDLRHVLRTYQEVCADAVARFDGHIAKYIGDGMLIYFGYPQAHEDDPQRAIFAALAIIDGVAGANLKLAQEHKVELAVRVAAHTGIVVVGEMGSGSSREKDAIVGETPNIAARLESLANPNSLVISQATHRLVAEHFDCLDLGLHKLKGISSETRIFRVNSEKQAKDHFENSDAAPLESFIGREAEIALLLNRWAQVKDAEGQLVLLSGEAGVGKSRTLQAFRRHLEMEDYSRVLYHGSPYHQSSAFYPVIEQIHRAMRFEREDSDGEKLHKLRATLRDLGVDGSEIVSPLTRLLQLNLEDHSPPEEISPQKMKSMTIEALVAVVDAMARQSPVLFVVEDAHWTDASTLEFIGAFADRLRNSRVLMLVTHRPDFAAPWTGLTHATTLSLNRLSRKEAIVLLGQITGDDALPDQLVDAILERADGVPLFIEELAKTVLESGLILREGNQSVVSGRMSELEIPSSLHDSLMARLDRLASVKEVAQLAAVIGRMFEHELLALVYPHGESELAEAISTLVDAELIYIRGTPPNTTYEFKHALVRDVAYQSLLKSARHQYHQQIAQALEKNFPDKMTVQPELLARHYTEARLPERAIPFWFEAAKQAAAQSATQEVIAHCRQILKLLASLPESPARDEQELNALLMLGPALMMSTGFGSADSAAIYERASVLASSLGNDTALFTVTWGQWLNHQQKAAIGPARKLAYKVEQIAARKNAPEMELQAHHACWTTNLVLARHGVVRDAVEGGLAIYDREKHRNHKNRFGGHDPGVCGLVHGAMVYWALGYPDKSIEYSEQAIEWAYEIAQPLTLAIALAMGGAFIRQYRREVPEVLDLSMRASQVCTEENVPHYLGVSHVLHGWSLAFSGEPGEGIAQIRRGLQMYGETGAALRQPYYLTLLAEACLKAGEYSEAFDALAQAHDAFERTGEQWWISEPVRIEGELALASSADDFERAEDCFRRAAAIARKQSAKSLELRATISLSQMWADRGRKQEAKKALEPIYAWFSEGFATADLKNAKQLIDQLS